MIKLIGKIRKNGKGSARILVIHCKNLVSKIRETKNKIHVSDFRDGVVIKPEGESHATIAAEKRIQIALMALIKNKIIDSTKIKKQEVPVYLDLSEWNLKEALRKSIGSPMTTKYPKNLTSKKAAIRTNKKNRYFLDISSKKLHELAKKETIKVLINRKKEIILVRSDKLKARRLTPHGKGRTQIAVPKEILKRKEILNLNKNSWLPTNIKLNLESFGLTLTDFYHIKEERQIAESLIEKKIKVKIKDYTDPYDIFLPEYNSCIETHNSIPNQEDFVTRHKVRPAMVRLRILEADFLIKNNKVNKFFLIINKKWKDKKYINELTEKIDKKVHIIYTDFTNNWNGKVGKEIINLLNKT